MEVWKSRRLHKGHKSNHDLQTKVTRVSIEQRIERTRKSQYSQGGGLGMEEQTMSFLVRRFGWKLVPKLDGKGHRGRDSLFRCFWSSLSGMDIGDGDADRGCQRMEKEVTSYINGHDDYF